MIRIEVTLRLWYNVRKTLPKQETYNMKEMTIDLKNYTENGTVFRRTAVRGIIQRSGKYLMIHSMKYGDYKFPGGGRHDGEELIDTLVREVQEETGYHVRIETAKIYMKVTERRKGDPDDMMEMVSWYYLCDVESGQGGRNLDEYEAEYDYRVEWMNLEEAIAANERVRELDAVPWAVRENEVMRQIPEDVSKDVKM